MSPTPPSPDPRIGLRGGEMNAAEAKWNMRVVSETPPPPRFLGKVNSDIAFIGNYAIQGSFDGYQVWDISNPAHPSLKTAYVCPGSQSDVSVYKNLLFVSGESLNGRLDCGTGGVTEAVSSARLRGVRIFDITDIANPRNVANVQTCRGSHTHTLLVDPKDKNNVYIYISGSSRVRSSTELAGCADIPSPTDPNSALFRIEVIKVPLAHPEQAAIVSSPRIFNNLTAPAVHSDAPEDIANNRKMVDAARANGGFVWTTRTGERVMPGFIVSQLLDSLVTARKGAGVPTSADTAKLRQIIPELSAHNVQPLDPSAPNPGPTQCHDITVYPAAGLAGGACAGYGLLLDIKDPAHPIRLAAAADSNFSYWHSATFNNGGTKVLFSDEWGGGTQAKCRDTDKREWGADAIFTLANGKPTFHSYYKLPAPQTRQENCVAHNGSLIPIPGRDIMVQAWYQGGVSVFDWTDVDHPREIAFFDRGPVDSTRLTLAGSWSAYWYNGLIVSSEIVRGLDIFELTPSAFISQNEIDAAKTVKFDYLNVQGQQRLVWPPSFALARAYVDQIARGNELSEARVSALRATLSSAESAHGARRSSALLAAASRLTTEAASSHNAARLHMLAAAMRDLARAGS